MALLCKNDCFRLQVLSGLWGIMSRTLNLGSESDGFAEFEPKYVKDCTKNWAPERRLGGGTFGVIYEARDADGLKFAALRLESKHPGYRQHMRDLTRQDLETLAAFEHRNILSVIGYSKSEESTVLLYSFPTGATCLKAALDSLEIASRLEWASRVKIFIGILAALDYCYFFRRVSGTPCYHRDVKPSNVFLTVDWIPKLVGCGLSRLIPLVDDDKTSALGIVGLGSDGGFLCPEFTRDRTFDEKSEVFSVGVTALQPLAPSSLSVVHSKCWPMASTKPEYFAVNCQHDFLHRSPVLVNKNET